MHVAQGLMHMRSLGFGFWGGPNLKLHAMTSSEVFEKRDLLWDKK